MLVLSCLIALTFTLLVAAVLRPQGRVAFLLTAYLIFFTHILSVFLIANAFTALSSKPVVFFIQLILTAGAALAWDRFGKPSLIHPFSGTLKNMLSGWKKSIRQNPALWLIGTALAAAFTFSAILVVTIPPNNNDSLSTHLSRIGYWLQQSSFLPWPILNSNPIFYPINAALQVYWTVLFTSSDRFAGFVQWFGGLITVLSVYGIALRLGGKRKQAAFAALVWGSFPLVLLQSSTTQLDLVAAGIFLPVIYFLISGIITRRRVDFALSGLALALSLGTKQTLLFLLPGLILFILLQYRHWKAYPAHLGVWVVSTVAGFLLFSVWIYAINYAHFGNFFGPPAVVSTSTGSHSAGGAVDNLAYNMPRLLYQSVDFSGLPDPVAAFGVRVKGKIVSVITQAIHFPIESDTAIASGHDFVLRQVPTASEDESWFGPLSWLLLLPAVLIEFIRSIRNRDPLRLGLILLASSYLPVNALLRPGWDPYQGRYFLPAAGLIAPLIMVWVQERPWSRWIQWGGAFLGVVVMGFVMIFNPAKPIISDDRDIFELKREDLQALQGHMYEGYIHMINRSLPEDSVVAFYSTRYLWDYPLFGEKFTRTVIPLVEGDLLADESWLKARGVEYVLVDVSDGFPEEISPKLVPYDEVKGSLMLYTWSRVNR